MLKAAAPSREHVKGFHVQFKFTFSEVTIFSVQHQPGQNVPTSHHFAHRVGKSTGVVVLLTDTRSNVDYLLLEVASKLFTFRTWKLNTVINSGVYQSYLLN